MAVLHALTGPPAGKGTGPPRSTVVRKDPIPDVCCLRSVVKV